MMKTEAFSRRTLLVALAALLVVNCLFFFAQLEVTYRLADAIHRFSFVATSSEAPHTARSAVAHSSTLSAVRGILALAQALLLFLVWRIHRTLGVSKIKNGLLALGAVSMFAEAIGSRAVDSSDIFAYIGYGMLGFAHAYAPEGAFPATFRDINVLWGFPIVPCYYGPLWLVLQRGATSRATSIPEAILATRVLSSLFVVATGFALARFKSTSAYWPLVVLNPGILTSYVAEGHNDVIGVFFATLAVLVALTAPIAAIVLLTCAALVKVSFLAFALVIFRGPGTIVRRLGYAAATVVLSCAGNALFAGPEFFPNLREHAVALATGRHLSYAEFYHPGLTHVLTAIAIAAFVLLFVRGVVLRSGGVPSIALAGPIHAWYLIWALPYQLLSERSLVPYLIAYPVLAVSIGVAALHLIVPAIVALAALAVYDGWVALRPGAG